MKNYEAIEMYLDSPGTNRKYTKNIFAQNGVLYNYGTHFPLLIVAPDGKIYKNCTKYSSSTSRVQGLCCVFDVESNTGDMKKLAENM